MILYLNTMSLTYLIWQIYKTLVQQLLADLSWLWLVWSAEQITINPEVWFKYTLKFDLSKVKPLA